MTVEINDDPAPWPKGWHARVPLSAGPPLTLYYSNRTYSRWFIGYVGGNAAACQPGEAIAAGLFEYGGHGAPLEELREAVKMLQAVGKVAGWCHEPEPDDYPW
jgi:hypothetical protein